MSHEQRIARRVQRETGLLYTTCLAATRSAHLRVPKDAPDFAERWGQLALEDAKARGLAAASSMPKAASRVYLSGEDGKDVPKPYTPEHREAWRKTVAEQHGDAAAGMAESSRASDAQRYEWAKRQSRGVEGELQPLKPSRRKP